MEKRANSAGLEFHAPATIPGGFDSSNFNADCRDETNCESNFNDEYYPNNATLLQSNEEISDILTPSVSPSSTSSKNLKKRSKRETVDDENDEKMKEAKYEEVLETQLEVHRLEKYKLLLEIGLLNAKRSLLGLPEEPETIDAIIYASL